MIGKGTVNAPKSITIDHHEPSTRTPGRFVTGLKTPGRATPRQESAGGLDRASDELAQENPGEGHGTTGKCPCSPPPREGIEMH